MTPRPDRSWVLTCCPVCKDDGDVLLAPVGAPELLCRVRCPHCGPLRDLIPKEPS